MIDGKFIVFEGLEGCGKTTAMAAVAERLKSLLPERDILTSRHPGATLLGKHIRSLLQYPENFDPEIKIDTLSEQLLMVTDMTCFINTVLSPSLKEGKIVLADRFSTISGLAYGVAGGLNGRTMNQMLQLVQVPKATRLYVLQCPWSVAKKRMKDRKLDRFERNDDAYFEKVQEVYDNLVKTPDRIMTVNQLVALRDVVYIDASQDPNKVVDDIVSDLQSQLSGLADS